MEQSVTNPEITNIYNSFNNMLMNPSAIIILVIVVIIYFILFTTLGSNTDNSSSSSGSILDSSSNNSSEGIGGNMMFIIIVVIFVILIFINGVQYFFGTDIIASIKNLFSETPEIDITINKTEQQDPDVVPEIKIAKQVFNIPGNNYVYPDAKALCSAYGGRLATYTEIEESYNKGGEWCNYGWSDGQMALFPTQQTTYDGLQKIPDHENDCGRPGINGGYMANPALKFGVNCYGYKPVMTAQEEELMQTQPHYPQTVKDIAMEKRVNYWKDKLNEILVSPFNYKNWSKI